MSLRTIGRPPLAKDDNGELVTRIGTVFPRWRTLVTRPGIHATQREDLIDQLNLDRKAKGQGPISGEEESAVWEGGVDLIFESDAVLIRPDPENMKLAFAADELLQEEVVPKRKVRFLNLLDERVRDAIKRRGECWRITPLPRDPQEMEQMIAQSRVGIGGKAIYYYNRAAGTRILTCENMACLGTLEDHELRRHLCEIQEYSATLNRLGNPEITFFMAEGRFGHADFANHDLAAMPGDRLREVHRDLRGRFRDAVPPAFRVDNVKSYDWRNKMYAALIGLESRPVPEELLLGLSSEFFMQVEWLPGARIEDGELLFDPIFDEPESPADKELCRLRDEKCRGFIINFVREYGDLEHVNVGRVSHSLSQQRPLTQGRRDVYIAELKLSGSEREVTKIIRMQKWGVRERLNEGRNLLDAIVESEEYTDYILDRRLGCRQLGMNIPHRIVARHICERYHPPRPGEDGFMIWSTYFERDYIRGIATDKMPNHKLAVPEYALRLAKLLGEAAAPNMIVGRCDRETKAVLFDDGDEVVIEDKHGLPAKIVVSDQTGSFVDYFSELAAFAPAYATVVTDRAGLVPDLEQFADVYIEAFVARFLKIQSEYRRRRRAFDNLFSHQPWDEAGSLSYRWYRVLQRLDRTDPREVGKEIRRHIPFAEDRPRGVEKVT